MKKFLGIVLVLCMLMGCVPAMAEIPSVFPYEGEEVTLRVMGWSGYYDFKWDSVFGQWLKETLCGQRRDPDGALLEHRRRHA